MEDKILDYKIKKYRIKEHESLKTSSKFLNDFTFIDKIKNKKKISYSDNSYLSDNCYPNYLYSDSTNVKISNSISGNFYNLNDIIKNLDIKNNYSSSFIRENRIIDLSHVKVMLKNSNQKDSLISENLINIKNKYIDSILIEENSMNLITLTYLKPDIIFDNDVNQKSNIYKQSWDSFNEYTLELSGLEKPLLGENNLILDFTFIKSGSSCPVYGSLYTYRDLEFTPNYTGQYRLQLGEYIDYENGEMRIDDSQVGDYSRVIVYPDKDVGSYDTGSTNGGMFSTANQYYLTKDQTCKIHTSFLKSQLEEGNMNPYLNLNVTLYGNAEKLYLSESELTFTNNNIPIENYYYLGTLYDTSSLMDKINIKILNIQSHLLLFDTKDAIFEEYEKYAINKYCNVKLKFVNSIYPLQYKQVTKSIEIRND